MGEAGDEPCSGVGFGVRLVGSVAVALDVSAKVRAEGFDELILPAPDAPVVKQAAAGGAGDPQVSLLRFSAAGHEVAHGGFVELEVVRGEGLGADGLGDLFQKADGALDPVDDEVARDADAVAVEGGLLAVKREVVDVFPDEEMGEKPCGGQSADKRRGGGRSDDGREVALDFAAELHTDDAAPEELRGGDVEQLGDFLAAAFEGLRIGGDEVGDDLGGLDGKAVEAGDAGAVGGAVFRGADRLSVVWRGLLRCVRAGGGFRLSRHVPEEQLELGGVDLLALRAEEAADQVVELGFKEAVGLLERLDFKRLAGDGLFGRFDAGDKAGNAPTTRFVIL